MSTRDLVAKAYCFRRELVWALQDKRNPIVSLATIEGLQTALQTKPPAELQRVAQELGIKLAQVGLHEC